MTNSHRFALLPMQITSLLRLPSAAQPLHGLGAPAAEPELAKSRHWLSILLLALVFGAGYHVLIFSRALVELELETNVRTVVKFYWPNQQGNYSEKTAALLQIKPGRTNYAVRVADIARMDRLRMDPSENKAARITIRKLLLRQTGMPSFQPDLGRLRMTGVDGAARTEQGWLALDVQGNDPQLEFDLPAMEKQVPWPEELGRWLAIVLLAAGCHFFALALFRRLAAVPVMAGFALALILSMAAISAVNTHPDESMHIAAGSYYQDHVLPPKVGDPANAHAYSAYGVSRLHSGEVYYLLAGKFLRLLRPFHLEPHLGLRLFNVLLFLGLLLHAMAKTEFRAFLLPLLLTPQIWYVFSYVDSDAFSVFMSTLAAHQLAAEDSAFNVMLRSGPGRRPWLLALLLGVFMGLLLLLKKNFYFSHLFLLLYFLWRLRTAGTCWTKEMAFRLATAVLLGGTLFLAFMATDAWVNDFRKKELVLEARERYADAAHKPSTPLKEKHAYLQMRERGESLRKLLDVDRWGEKTFRSSFGVYGYTQYSAPFAYYSYVRAAGLLLLLTLGLAAVCRGGRGGASLLAIAGVCALLLVSTMLWKSWTVDFQTQGRYLLPLAPMLAVLHHHCQRIVVRPLFYSLTLALFALSAYNFVFVGLLEIGKAV